MRRARQEEVRAHLGQIHLGRTAPSTAAPAKAPRLTC